MSLLYSARIMKHVEKILLVMILLSASTSYAESLAGRIYNHIVGQNFSFDQTSGSFAAITYNPLTQTWFMTDNKTDALFEIQADGTLLRTIDISGLHATGVTTDAEGVTWMYGQTFALALHDGKELAIAQITPTTTAIARADATIYDVSSWPGKPKGVTYVGADNALYGVTKNSPMAVVKSQIVNGQLQTVWTKTVDNLPVADLADVSVFHRLSPNFILISESSKAIMEVDLTGSTAVVKSTFSLSGWPIPQAGGLTFGADANMYVVGKHASGLPQQDFSVFAPTSTITNRPPVALIALRTGT